MCQGRRRKACVREEKKSLLNLVFYICFFHSTRLFPSLFLLLSHVFSRSFFIPFSQHLSYTCHPYSINTSCQREEARQKSKFFNVLSCNELIFRFSTRFCCCSYTVFVSYNFSISFFLSLSLSPCFHAVLHPPST